MFDNEHLVNTIGQSQSFSCSLQPGYYLIPVLAHYLQY